MRLANIPAPLESLAVFSTKLGWIAFVMRGQALARLTFGHRSAAAAALAVGRLPSGIQRGDKPRDLPTRDLVDRLIAYAAGAADDFLDIETETSHLTAFSKSIVEAVRRIPIGQTRSYGRLAALVGRPRAARAVGRVMAQNRTPLVVPCHRVVGSGGDLGGFSAIDGLAMKRRLLKLETASMVTPA
jgi:methylated-DNA-[protein]-cysteine S-methyltransferase